MQSLFPMITKGDDFTVLVETSAPDTYVYASVVDNETNQTHFIQPSISTTQAQEAAASVASSAVFFALMDEPEYLICLECETPTYQFEFGRTGNCAPSSATRAAPTTRPTS